MNNGAAMSGYRKGMIVLFVSVLCCIVAGQASAQRLSDRVRLARGSETGEVTAMTPFGVTLSKGLPGDRTIAVNEIRSVIFDNEPTELSQARVNANNGAYQNALENLAKIDAGKVQRDFIREDLEFYKAWCAGQLALGGEGEIIEAGRQLNTFVRSHPQNFHYLAAVEMMGDLLMAGERYENAQKQYADLAKAPWPAYKMRAAVLIGRTLQAQEKHSEAIQQFDAALAITDDGPDSENQRLAATLGKAVSLAESGGGDEAVSIIEKVIHDADPQQKELHARAYNALGRCYEKAGKTKDALLAYLHVDVLYSNVPEAHAEALAQLAPLWKAIGQEERAREARQLLEERYGKSRWAQPSR
jgi:tetratricopeptide (TPR) repeat protein